MAKAPLIYKKIASDIAQLIKDGPLKANEQIMPVSDLCEKYNTSHVTVLKALNHLREEGYVTSQKGKGYFVAERTNGIYSGKKHGAIGIIIRPLREITFCDDCYNMINIGIQQECIKQHLNFYYTHTTGALNVKNSYKRFMSDIEQACLNMADSVDGFIVDKRISDEVAINIKKRTGKPIVIIGRSTKAEADCVMPECIKSPDQIIKTLLRHNYEFFILGNSGIHNDEVNFRAATFDKALKKYKIPEDCIARFEDYYINPLQQSYDTIKDIWEKQSNGRKTVVIADGDKFCQDFCSCLIKDKIRPGKDIGIVGHGNYGYDLDFPVKLTTVDINPMKIGQMAVDILQNRISNGAYDPYQVYSPESTFIIGETI